VGALVSRLVGVGLQPAEFPLGAGLAQFAGLDRRAALLAPGGREALEEKAKGPHRKKVTLVWNPDDTARAFRSLLDGGPMARYMDVPWLHYAGWQYDKVLNRQGELVGLALYAGYSANERAVLALAVVEEAYSQPGTDVVLVWGEEDGGARSAPWLERHEPVEIRATVGPVPISRATQEYWAAVKARR
jgi:vanillate/3-O-methylgallate O-demethylase